MNSMKNFVIPVTLLLSFFPLIARAYDDAGTTMFRDIGFGGVVGLGVGALVLVANKNSSNVASDLATSTLIGAGAGLVFGVVELTVEHHSKYSENDSKLKVRPLVTFTDSDRGFSYYRDELLSNPLFLIDLKKAGMGVNVSYIF